MRRMAATATRSPARQGLSDFRSATEARLGDTPPGAAALGVGLAIVVLYAMFASGAIDIPDETRLQVGVALLSLATLAGVLFGRGLRVAGVPGAGLGIVLLAGFAAWSALSIAWSISPDQSWLWANRAIAYTLVAWLALALGSSLPRAPERVAGGFLAIATFVSLYALAGKVIPWVEVPGLFDLNTAEQFARLRAPIDYWNALGMVMVLAIPIALRGATAWDWPVRFRVASAAALVPLALTLILTYSRGGLIALAVAVAVLVWAGPDRTALFVTFVGGLLAAAPATIFALTRDSLTDDNVPVGDRDVDGLILGVLILIGIVLAVRLAAWVADNRERLVLGPHGRRLVLRGSLAAVVAVVLGLVVAAGVSDRGLTGTVSHQWDEFTTAKEDKTTDASRVLQANSGNRWVWWMEALGAWSDRPLVGHGAGSFPLLHRQYRDDLTQVKQPHSVPLEFLSETGLIGGLLVLGGLLLLAGLATVGMLARPPGLDRAFAAAMLAALAGFGLHMWIDWDWDIPAVMLPVMIFLGVLVARPPTQSEYPVAAPGIGTRAIVFGIGCVAAGLIAVSAILPWYSSKLTNDALSLASTNTEPNLKEAARKAALAKRLNPFTIQPLLAEASVLERGNQGAAAYDSLVEAVKLQPANSTTWLRLSRLEFLLDKPGAATSSALTALSLDPSTLLTGGGFVLQLVRNDPARSASVAGTPLPVKVITVPVLPATPATPGGGGGGPAAPAPTAPTPTPTPAPEGGGGGGDDGGGGGGGGGGEPFRLEG
jgi:hypothetical protein